MEERRQLVKGMASYGMKEEEIAKVLQIKSTSALREHFQKELELGPVEANGQVAQTLYEMATTGKSTAAQCFWLKTRSRWYERPHEVPQQQEDMVVHLNFVDPEGLSKPPGESEDR